VLLRYTAASDGGLNHTTNTACLEQEYIAISHIWTDQEHCYSQITGLKEALIPVRLPSTSILANQLD
jgi:hypothetical protein